MPRKPCKLTSFSFLTVFAKPTLPKRGAYCHCYIEPIDISLSWITRNRGRNAVTVLALALNQQYCFPDPADMIVSYPHGPCLPMSSWGRHLRTASQRPSAPMTFSDDHLAGYLPYAAFISLSHFEYTYIHTCIHTYIHTHFDKRGNVCDSSYNYGRYGLFRTKLKKRIGICS